MEFSSTTATAASLTAVAITDATCASIGASPAVSTSMPSSFIGELGSGEGSHSSLIIIIIIESGSIVWVATKAPSAAPSNG